ncbi:MULTISPECIES: MmoB/DmpM family protein [Cycloclasticus]|uniref:Phenol hydroxylase, P2 regulatory component DmpM n=1 Tax=Cycloclasticus zancles 78-ME TaxID=1198232 RepID=S5TA21_9GAMM|nr:MULTISPECIES: MmoB/DmpM family protein [Cycloclasticus]AGS40424.1 Phenol hydroxylase, P2 regulatory component DmpM [Cycloclasticus zancles 78-ME]MDF1829774.1 MmoB/DmpM family protein [Cycloclasticus pugetii]PHR52233.1 MAG: monooxygenase [Cycloclasticus sp.]SHI91299.1 phenol hydroxylase P2 protein [Cycloclasticus pugetii]
MSDKKNTVFLILQDNEDARPIIEAVELDNPKANIQHQPGMVRMEGAGKLVVNRETVEEQIGRDWDVQELHLNLVSLAGNVDEDEDKFELSWH